MIKAADKGGLRLSQPGDTAESRRKTAASDVKQILRDSIMRGEVLPGQRLTLGEVAERTGYGQMPVREALFQLEGEGILEVSPHRGAVVRPVDAKFVFDMYEVRRSLDGLLVRNAVPAMRADALARLVAAQLAYEAAKGADTQTILARNAAFHAIINQVGDNPVASGILNRGWELVHALRVRFGFGRDRLETIIVEHRELVDACQRRDVEAAVAVAERHTVTARDDLLALLA